METNKKGTVDDDVTKECTVDDKSYDHYWFDIVLPSHVEVGQEFTIHLVNYDNMRFKVCCP